MITLVISVIWFQQAIFKSTFNNIMVTNFRLRYLHMLTLVGLSYFMMYCDWLEKKTFWSTILHRCRMRFRYHNRRVWDDAILMTEVYQRFHMWSGYALKFHSLSGVICGLSIKSLYPWLTHLMVATLRVASY